MKSLIVLYVLAAVYRARSQEPGGEPKASCIHGDDHASTLAGTKRVADLHVGDQVAVGNGKFEPIVNFLHRDTTRNSRGFKFEVSSGVTAGLSDEHLVFIAPNKRAVLAKNVKIGDRLYVEKGDGFQEEKVVAIERKDLEGRLSPLTPSGVILVNNILVSCYSQIEDHDLMHSMVNWLMPFTRSIFEDVFGKTSSDGMHWVGDVLYNFYRHFFITVEGK